MLAGRQREPSLNFVQPNASSRPGAVLRLDHPNAWSRLGAADQEWRLSDREHQNRAFGGHWVR